MKIIVSNNIVIQQASHVIRDYCNDKLVVRNPDFYKLQRLGKWTGNTPEKIYLYESIGDTLILPFGCLQDVWKICPDKLLYNVHFEPLRRCNCESSINLYDYQETAVNAVLNAKNGILVMPCGAGKTQTGLEIISQVGGRALWLTHTQELLNQSMQRAKSTLDCDTNCYGTITAGKVNIGSHITFATVQTLCRIDLSQYKDMWDIIIVDEAQHCCGSPTRVTQFYKVLSNLAARYKIGLTATPKRNDGLEQAMFALLGGIIHTVSREGVTERTCKVVIRAIETGYQPNMDNVLGGDGMLDYMALIDDLISSEERFKKVLKTIENLDGSAIVLANRVAYLQRLNDEYSRRSVCLSGAGYTKKAKAERKAALDKLRCGDIDIVFSTYQLAAEGLDVPNLRYVVFTTPEKNETCVIQAVGRVGRKANGKECGTVIDFVDDFGMFQGWYKKRKGFYKKIGAEVRE